MRAMIYSLALGGLMLTVSAMPARGQAVAFTPVPGVAPDGVFLNVTPVATADRRYVRLGVNTASYTFGGFQVINVPAAVGGGGLGGGGVGLPANFGMSLGSPFNPNNRTPLGVPVSPSFGDGSFVAAGEPALRAVAPGPPHAKSATTRSRSSTRRRR